MSSTDINALRSADSPTRTSVPDNIVKAVNKGECILFLGAMASAPSPENCTYKYSQGPPGGAKLAARLASRCGYPDKDDWNLARVSLYFATRKDQNRYNLIQAIAEEVVADTVMPSPALHMLAALPFPIVVTTNYDRLFDTALGSAKSRNGKQKQPLIRVYDPSRKEEPDYVPLEIKEDEPVLLKIHGDIKNSDSIVITEEDYIVFIHRMSDLHIHPVHENIRVRMKQWPILFIGYSLKDYNLRLLFRALRWISPERFPLSYSVDPRPDELIVSVWQDAGEKQRMIYFVEQDLWHFVPALYKACFGTEYQSHE